MTAFTDLSSVLHAHATKNPQKTALICGDAIMSYRDLDEATTALAHWFLDQGLRPGDRVALHWSNSIEVVQLFFALFKAGLIAVTVNVRLKAPEIRYVLNHSQARMCFSEPALAPLARQAGTGCPIFTQIPAVKTMKAGRNGLPAPAPDKPAVVVYTSGTTANPKGVTHTHRSLLHTAAITARAIPIEPDAVAMTITQMMHAAALNIVLLPALYTGASTALLPAFEPGAVLDAIQRFRCTYAFCLPALLHFIVEEQEREPHDVSSLRTMVAGGDTVPVALQQKFQKLFATRIREGYGMTETLPMALTPGSAIRPGAMGVAPEGFQVRIVDIDGLDVAEGETGEVVVRSSANCAGYWNDREATKALMRDGWLHTGDLASRDADGYFWFKGRLKQIIIRAGSNISPQEVEEALYQHPAVLEAGVVGQPDKVLGEIVVAFVVLREGEKAMPEELRDFARQRLADYKVPERVLFLDEMPKNAVGKVQRRALKEMLPGQPDVGRLAVVS